ncbi:MAG: hypothetical protein SVM80_12980 [Halobacteriota archaeon]|nr:hypothetical protein [Halobacteriota archaeon]
MKRKGIAMGTIFVVILLLMTTCLPVAGSASKGIMEKWMKEHTVKVKSTTTYEFEKGNLTVEEAYSGNDLEKRFEVETLVVKQEKMPVKAKSIAIKEGEEVFTIRKGERKVISKEKITVLTNEDDPPPWWLDRHARKSERRSLTTENMGALRSEEDLPTWWFGFDYPQWTWSRHLGIGWVYEKGDPGEPINLAWENTNETTVKSEIIGEGWKEVSPTGQLPRFVYDPVSGEWIEGDGVADKITSVRPRYHARLWQLPRWNKFMTDPTGDVEVNNQDIAYRPDMIGMDCVLTSEGIAFQTRTEYPLDTEKDHLTLIALDIDQNVNTGFYSGYGVGAEYFILTIEKDLIVYLYLVNILAEEDILKNLPLSSVLQALNPNLDMISILVRYNEADGKFYYVDDVDLTVVENAVIHHAISLSSLNDDGKMDVIGGIGTYDMLYLRHCHTRD